MKATVKLKVKTTKTDDPEEVEYAIIHAQIVCTPSSYELLLPTELNEKLKPYLDNDFDMEVVEEGETLKVILTKDKQSTKKNRPT